MATQEVAIRQTVNITLKSDTEMLDDVVVVAYGTAKKSSFTGSATAVSGEKIAKMGSIRNSGAFVKLPSQYC